MNNNLNFIQQLTQIIQTTKNPDLYFQNIARQNPQLNALLNQKNQTGMTWQEFTYQFAKQQGFNIDEIVNGLKNNGIRL